MKRGVGNNKGTKDIKPILLSIENSKKITSFYYTMCLLQFAKLIHF